jgi:hypothetical protein
MNTASHTLFVDESGNAGINYLDEDQPFHVAAGVLIANEDMTTFRRVIASMLLPDEPELKGARLLKNAEGQRRTLSIINAIGEAGGMPFFIIMERRFSLAAKIVDVFLDPMHQDAVDWLPTSAIQQRHEISEKLFKILSSGVLDDFARAYRKPTVDGFRQTLQGIVALLRRHDESQLVTAFEGALANVSNVVKSETYGDASSTHGQWASLNLPAFAHLLRQPDVFMDMHPDLFDVVHDRTLQFEALFDRITGMFSVIGAEAPDLRLSDGRRYRSIYRNLRSFRTDDSISEVALQAADVIASAVARVARMALRPVEEWTEELQRLAEVTLSALMLEDDSGTPLVAGIFADSNTKVAILTRILLHGQRSSK